MNIVKNLVLKSKYNIKCPYPMTATRFVVHETANDASARNEIAYMIRNNNTTSFHFAVDDKEVVQGIPLDRNAFHAGDGNGKGNREGIAVEICYSKSGGERWRKAVDNAARFIAEGLKERGWGIDKVTKHQDYSGKNCPHRILSDYGWTNFLNLVSAYMNPPKKSVEELAREVIAGLHGNGHEARKASLAKQGYTNYEEIRNKVNELYGKKTTTNTSTAPAAPKVNYFPRYTGESGSIAPALNEMDITSSFSYRAKIAKVNGIKLYTGTIKQNTTMLNLLKQGKLIKP